MIEKEKKTMDFNESVVYGKEVRFQIHFLKKINALMVRVSSFRGICYCRCHALPNGCSYAQGDKHHGNEVLLRIHPLKMHTHMYKAGKHDVIRMLRLGHK